MNDVTMTIKVEAPELALAITKLAGALLDEKALAAIFAEHMRKNICETSVSSTPAASPAAPQPPVAAPVAAPVPPAAPLASVTPPTSAAAPVPPVAAPVAPPAPAPAAPAVPVAGAPTYTLDQIAKAGASLVDAGKMEPLLALLSRYGVQAVTQLAPEHYGAFATELRALGAQI